MNYGRMSYDNCDRLRKDELTMDCDMNYGFMTFNDRVNDGMTMNDGLNDSRGLGNVMDGATIMCTANNAVTPIIPATVPDRR